MHLPNLHIHLLLFYFFYNNHELKMRFKPLNFAFKLFNAAKKDTPLLLKIYRYETFLFILQ